MKKIKIIAILALTILANELYSQVANYYEGKTSFCYGGECYLIENSPSTYGICNLKNLAETGILPWRVDGKPRESEEFEPDIRIMYQHKVHQAFIETFTPREIEALKNETEVMLIGFNVNPVNGTVSEVSFWVYKDRFPKIVTPDKIYKLEKLLKSYVTFGTSDPFLRRYNYIATTLLYKFKFTQDFKNERPAFHTTPEINVNGMYIDDKYTYAEMVAKLGNPTGSRTYTGTGTKADITYTEYRYGNSLFVFESNPWGNKFVEFTLKDSNFLFSMRLCGTFSVGAVKNKSSFNAYTVSLIGTSGYKLILDDGYVEIYLESLTFEPNSKVASIRFVPTK